MVKISALPQDNSPTTTDSMPSYDAETGSTKRFLISALITLLFTQTNIPSGGGSPVTHEDEGHFDYVASGGVWSGDSYGTNRNASMTAMIIYINGRRISISAVTARTFTASKDTYIDVLDNADGTGTLVYTEVTNNAASPALAANSVRIAIIVTGASTIANAGSVNQGQEDKALPVVSGSLLAVTDNDGNLICPRDPERKILAIRQITASVGSITTITDIIAAICIVPNGRKIKITAYAPQIYSTTATDRADWQLRESSTVIQTSYGRAGVSTDGWGGAIVEKVITPTAGSHTYKVSLTRGAGAGSLTVFSDATTAQATLIIGLV